MSHQIAVFGGSFNPPHCAHQLVAWYVLETCEVDGVGSIFLAVAGQKRLIPGPGRDVAGLGGRDSGNVIE